MEQIKIGIAGYGNVGRGVEKAVLSDSHFCLEAVFTRRNPHSIQTLSPQTPVFPAAQAPDLKNSLDAVILCLGSASDLPVEGPFYARHFNTVDSFDTHKKIPQYIHDMNLASSNTGHLSIVSAGWDPGLFSLMRLYSRSCLPDGSDYTFWGNGVSQGHSDALKKIFGVRHAIQYTIPKNEAIEKIRAGKNPVLVPRAMHLRECYIVPEEGANQAEIERKIKTMPYYFDEYDTVVHFISEDEFNRCHRGMPHGGFVLRNGATGKNRHTMEFSLKLSSNPEFTAGVLLSFVRAAVKLSRKGENGVRTVFDIPPVLLFDENPIFLL